LFWDTGLGVSAVWQNNQIVGDPSSDKVTWRAAAVIRTALQLEFLIKNRWGILFEGEYQGIGRPMTANDRYTYAAQWINVLAVSAGVRYYFDTREREHDSRLDENELPIRKPRKPHQIRSKAPKNAVYVNVNLTPELVEEARENDGKVAMQVSPLPLSKEIDGALQVLDEQGSGTALINSIHFINDQLTPDAMQILDKIAGSLLANQKWTSADMLYVSNEHATARAAAIANYLRGKGVKNLVVKGRDAYTEVDSSDLIITIK
jgi:outer membrane protein OmpA-like peptidoglycan-associated protein